MKYLIGKTITQINKREEEGEITELILTTDDGVYRMYHEQDCCEHVYLEDIEGSLLDIQNSPLLQAEEVTNRSEGREDSQTWTFYKLGTIKGRVTLRWLGTSNGYYSEDVEIKRIA